VLLTIRDEVKPMLDYFSERNKAPPSIEHFRLQVVISAIPTLPSSNRFCEQLLGFISSILSDIFDLMLSESFTGHQIAQICHIELLVEYFLRNWSDLVHLDHG